MSDTKIILAGSDGVGLAQKLLEEGGQPKASLKRRVTMIGSIDENLTFWAAVGSLLVSMLGPGIVAFPYAIALCGYMAGPVVLTIFCALAYESYGALLRSTRKLQVASYDGLLTKLPAAWGYCANICLAITLTLAVTMYIIIASHTLGGIASSLPGGDLLATNPARFAVILAAIFPLCLTRSLSGLSAATSFCFGCIVVMSLLVVWLCTAQMADPVSSDTVVFTKATSPEQMLRALPIFACSMFGHMNFPRLYAELQPEAKPQAESVALTALVLLCSLLLAFSLAGYAAFGGAVQEDVLVQLAAAQGEGLVISIVQSLMLIFVIVKTPLLIFPMRGLVLAAGRPGDVLADLSMGENTLLSASLLLLIYGVACLLPGLDTVMTILGAVCVVPLTFVFPARLLHLAEPCDRPWRSGMLGMVGLLTSVLGLYVFLA